MGQRQRYKKPDMNTSEKLIEDIINSHLSHGVPNIVGILGLFFTVIILTVLGLLVKKLQDGYVGFFLRHPAKQRERTNSSEQQSGRAHGSPPPTS